MVRAFVTCGYEFSSFPWKEGCRRPPRLRGSRKFPRTCMRQATDVAQPGSYFPTLAVYEYESGDDESTIADSKFGIEPAGKVAVLPCARACNEMKLSEPSPPFRRSATEHTNNSKEQKIRIWAPSLRSPTARSKPAVGAPSNRLPSASGVSRGVIESTPSRVLKKATYMSARSSFSDGARIQPNHDELPECQRIDDRIRSVF